MLGVGSAGARAATSAHSIGRNSIIDSANSLNNATNQNYNEQENYIPTTNDLRSIIFHKLIFRCRCQIKTNWKIRIHSFFLFTKISSFFLTSLTNFHYKLICHIKVTNLHNFVREHFFRFREFVTRTFVIKTIHYAREDF